MEQPMKEHFDSKYYQDNLDRLLSAAEHRVAALRLQKEIRDIEAKLRVINRIIEVYPPPEGSAQCPDQDIERCDSSSIP